MKIKFLLAFLLGFVYFFLFAVLGRLLYLETVHLIFLCLVSGFEYVGIEKLLCLDTYKNKTYFKAGELFCTAVVLPMAVYAVLCAFDADTFSCCAAVSMGTAAYKGIWILIEPTIKK